MRANTIAEEVARQIDAAFDFRGHVTVSLKSGGSIEGFMFNRQLEGAEPFVELMLKGSAERQRLPAGEIASVALTGEDCAAGKSYDDYLKKKASNP